jgi:hypothetical protein
VTDTNALSRAVSALRDANDTFDDLTESNPTRVGLPYGAHLLDVLSDADGLAYEPFPRGLPSARQAIASDCARRGVTVDPADIVLCASTSEAYSWLFKLLCRPGEAVLIPQPSYPLFEHLTRLESVHAIPYRLEHHGRWTIDFESLTEAHATVRAVLVVSPNNPTGTFISRREFDMLTAVCRERGWAIIADEVFADYPLDERRPLTDLASRAEVMTFTLAGFSKTLGLPQLKLAWIVVGGPRKERETALNGLEFVADTYLSVSTPVQRGATALLREGASVREAIRVRIQNNLSRARDIAGSVAECTIPSIEGGWSVPIRVPAVRSEESLVLALLEHERVLVHPGYYFDFPHAAFVVISLLPEEAVFSDALSRALRFLAGTK